MYIPISCWFPQCLSRTGASCGTFATQGGARVGRGRAGLVVWLEIGSQTMGNHWKIMGNPFENLARNCFMISDLYLYFVVVVVVTGNIRGIYGETMGTPL